MLIQWLLIFAILWFLLRAFRGKTASIRRWSVVYAVACLCGLSIPLGLSDLIPALLVTILLLWLAFKSITYATGGLREDGHQR